MTTQQFLTSPEGRKLAYVYTPGRHPAVVFLGGFMSDMQGSKACDLEAWAVAQGRAFLRFDYSGHGASEGEFTDGTISAWVADAVAVIKAHFDTPVVLVGSSMGGWISLLLAQRQTVPIAGLLGIAAAPDFTEDSMWAEMSQAQRDEVIQNGIVYLPSDYDAPYPISKNLLLDGRNNLVLRQPLALPFPARFLHGMADRDVTMDRPLAIMDHAAGADMHLTFVKDADHRFSTPKELILIRQTVADILAAVAQDAQ